MITFGFWLLLSIHLLGYLPMGLLLPRTRIKIATFLPACRFLLFRLYLFEPLNYVCRTPLRSQLSPKAEVSSTEEEMI